LTDHWIYGDELAWTNPMSLVYYTLIPLWLLVAFFAWYVLALGREAVLRWVTRGRKVRDECGGFGSGTCREDPRESVERQMNT
jgi:hypothetical protein